MCLDANKIHQCSQNISFLLPLSWYSPFHNHDINSSSLLFCLKANFSFVGLCLFTAGLVSCAGSRAVLGAEGQWGRPADSWCCHGK